MNIAIRATKSQKQELIDQQNKVLAVQKSELSRREALIIERENAIVAFADALRGR